MVEEMETLEGMVVRLLARWQGCAHWEEAVVRSLLWHADGLPWACGILPWLSFLPQQVWG
jgi:hypothetical protein